LALENLVILRKHVLGLSEAALARFTTRASRAVGLRGLSNVLVTTSRELRALNRRFRGKDQPTDVLSFSPQPGFGDAFAGDIAISAEIARQNAQSLGHSEAQEIKILVLHGVLHLAGYDHENDNGVMAGKEAKLRKVLGLPVGLIERNGLTLTRKGTEKAGKAIRKGMKRVENLSESSLESVAGGRARAALVKTTRARTR
jgi:probable rRNA maturation factor